MEHKQFDKFYDVMKAASTLWIIPPACHLWCQWRGLCQLVVLFMFGIVAASFDDLWTLSVLL
eukprot:775830-Amphidinium_carterae.1